MKRQIWIRQLEAGVRYLLRLVLMPFIIPAAAIMMANEWAQEKEAQLDREVKALRRSMREDSGPTASAGALSTHEPSSGALTIEDPEDWG